MNGKVLFLQMPLILKFSREKRSIFFFFRHFPSEAGAPFNFQPRVQGGSGSISVWEDGWRRLKELFHQFFVIGRLDGPTYINMIKKHWLSCIKKSFKQNNR